MSSITVKMKSGELRKFPHQGRSGGSYSKTLTLENGFAIITDEWGTRTIIPSEDIDAIVEEPTRRSF